MGHWASLGYFISLIRINLVIYLKGVGYRGIISHSKHKAEPPNLHACKDRDDLSVNGQ